MDNAGAKAFGFRSSDWQWLVNPLFKAIEINSELLLPIISVSLVRPTDFFGESYVIFEEFMRQWIGPRQDELAEWLIKTDANWPTEHVKESFKMVKDWAKKRLACNKK